MTLSSIGTVLYVCLWGNGTRGKKGEGRLKQRNFLVRLMHTEAANYARPRIINNKGVTDRIQELH